MKATPSGGSYYDRAETGSSNSNRRYRFPLIQISIVGAGSGEGHDDDGHMPSMLLAFQAGD